MPSGNFFFRVESPSVHSNSKSETYRLRKKQKKNQILVVFLLKLIFPPRLNLPKKICLGKRKIYTNYHPNLHVGNIPLQSNYQLPWPQKRMWGSGGDPNHEFNLKVCIQSLVKITSFFHFVLVCWNEWIEQQQKKRLQNNGHQLGMGFLV